MGKVKNLFKLSAVSLLLTCSFSSHAMFWPADYSCNGTNKNTGMPLPNVEVRAFTHTGAIAKSIMKWRGQANPFAIYCEKAPQ